MAIDYNQATLREIDKSLNIQRKKIVIDGKSLTLNEIVSCAYTQSKIEITRNSKVLNLINLSHQKMLQNVREGVPVYGTNSSFGGQAARLHNKGDSDDRVNAARMISDSLVFLDVGTGKAVPVSITRAAMLIRVNMLLQGVSGIRLSTLENYLQLVNKNIIPVVSEFGGIGASGDLTHNQRIISVLTRVNGAKVINEKGKVENARRALTRNKITRLDLDPKEGLALVNGDNFSTSFACIVAHRLVEYLQISQVLGAIVIEVLKGSDRSFHSLLSSVRPHKGQAESSEVYRYLLSGSKLARQEMTGHKLRENGIKVQDGYSIRCIPQFEGVMIEKMKWCLNVISVNANSVSDNPLWVSDEYAVDGEEPWQWVSGGNFLAMHMVEVMDSMRKITTQLIKKNDRHLARMIDPIDSNGLPANLSDLRSIDQCTFKGVQIQSGMLEVYSMLLAAPVSTMFGIHEERNQDITTHAVTSGIMALENLNLLKYSLAGNLLAVAQAVDLRGGSALLSPRTRPLYEFVRGVSKHVGKNRPLAIDIEKLSDTIETGRLAKMLREEVFNRM